jgi:hypothetical protein
VRRATGHVYACVERWLRPAGLRCLFFERARGLTVCRCCCFYAAAAPMLRAA